MEQVLRLSSRFTIREKYCKLTNKMRTFKNKGAILLLVWNSLVINVLYYVLTQTMVEGAHFISLFFTLLIAGWLADVYLGRYKVIRKSMCIMWTATMLMTLSSVLAQLVDSYTRISDKVTAAILFIQTIGFAGYQANILQFGIDQFPDASTNAIKSYIIWFIWTYFTGGIAAHYIYGCISEEYHAVGKCIICVFLTIALVLAILLDDVLIKEPVVQNPYKLLYKVIKYSLKHKHPRYRSAFTYCEDELPSRIDFGKSKYGGPFTTEQVEDVKTFLRILAVVVFGSILPGLALIIFKQSYMFISLVIQQSNTSSITECFVESISTGLTFCCGIVLIPLHEIFVYPLMHKYFHWVKSYHKFFLGVVLQIVRIVALMLIEVKSRDLYFKHYGSNATIQCTFSEKGGILSSTFNIWWMAIPSTLNSISCILLGIGGYEFICAQTPYSMRGLIFGATYGSGTFFMLVGYGISEPFTRHLIDWGTGVISCGFWYLLLNVLLMALYSAALLILIRHYKKRKREDVLPNEHIFAERYYDKD